MAALRAVTLRPPHNAPRRSPSRLLPLPATPASGSFPEAHEAARQPSVANERRRCGSESPAGSVSVCARARLPAVAQPPLPVSGAVVWDWRPVGPCGGGQGGKGVVGLMESRPAPGVVLGADRKREAWQSRPQVFPPLPPFSRGLGFVSATTASCGEVLRSRVTALVLPETLTGPDYSFN